MSDRELRRQLWLRHGCKATALYGDDGEMTCGECGVDFKRDDGAKIKQLLERNDQRQFAALVASGQAAGI